MKLTSDLIYEAALDDEIFAQLPASVAAALDARSCVLHWRDQDGSAEVFAHSGYFSDEQMANYATNFVDHDLWTAAGMRQGFVNQAWKTSDLVSSDEYGRSIFYNEWIRAMGDDTYHCCGSVMETVHGNGIIGLHRGRTQSDFSDAALQDINVKVGHLRRMFAIRGRISGLQGRSDLLDEIFNAGPRPALKLGADRRLLMANVAGDQLLSNGRFLRMRWGQVQPASDADREAFDRAVARAMDGERSASDCIVRGSDGCFVIASITPLVAHSAQRAVLVTIEEPRPRVPRALLFDHLQRVYALSPAEADVAMRIADGQTVRQISDQRGATVGTVRIQVKQVLSKMGVRRQAEVVRLIAAGPSANDV